MDDENTRVDPQVGEGPASASENAPEPAPASVPSPIAGSQPIAASTAIPGVTASECASCSAKGGNREPSLVYALGQLDYDFGTEARRDSFRQHGVENPHNPAALLEHLEENPPHASAITWTLVQDTTPIYAVMPHGPFAAEAYGILRELLKGQLAEGVERVSIPGYLAGPIMLMNGQQVPVVVPEIRGMYSWSTSDLIQAVAGEPPEDDEGKAQYAEKVADVGNFLERVYHEIRNLGVTPQERSINYAATNAFQIEHVYSTALQGGLKLDSISVDSSPICRPGADCWDVKLTFFNPQKRLEQAREVYRFTIDVSDVVPVTVGPVRHWHVF